MQMRKRVFVDHLTQQSHIRGFIPVSALPVLTFLECKANVDQSVLADQTEASNLSSVAQWGVIQKVHSASKPGHRAGRERRCDHRHLDYPDIVRDGLTLNHCPRREPGPPIISLDMG